jgi:hypothetical protein
VRARTKVIRSFQMGSGFYREDSEHEFELWRAQRLAGEGLVSIVAEIPDEPNEPVETSSAQKDKKRRRKR